MKVIYCVTLLAVIFVGGVSCEYNFTYAMAAHCKEHICREGYRYVTFYAIDKGAYKYKNTSAGLVLEMHIAILAPKDGHIMLSTLPDPKPTDPVYEIVIGGGNNSFSELRRMRQRYAKSSQLTRNILSPIEYRAFWIKMGIDGVLEIGEEGSDIAKLTYMDPDPLRINYFSFAGWYGVEAKFLYDCPLPGDMAELLPNSKIVEEPPLPPTLQLRKWILRQTLGSPPPVVNSSSRVSVTVWATQVLAAQLDVIESQLEVNMFVIMGWQDPRLYWNATAYEGHDGIIFENSELWTPQLTVSNGIGLDALDPGEKSPIYVNNEGYIVHTFTTRFKAWCDAGTGITRWPKDDHVCTLEIGPIGPSHQFVLSVKSVNKDESNTNVSLASYSNPWDMLPETSEWEITSMSLYTEWYSLSPGVKISEEIKGVNVDPEGVSDTKLMIRLYLRRRNSSMSTMVYTPLFALMFFSLASLWIPNSNTILKTWSSLVLIPIGCSLLYTIEGFVPFISDELPDVAYIYTCMIYTALIYWIVHVLRDHYISRRFINSSPAISVMSWSPLRTALGLPLRKDSERYKTLEECSSTSADTEEILERTNQDQTVTASKRYDDFVSATDRILFMIYLIFYATIVCKHII